MYISYMLLQIVRTAEGQPANVTLELGIFVVMQGGPQVAPEVCFLRRACERGLARWVWAVGDVVI